MIWRHILRRKLSRKTTFIISLKEYIMEFLNIKFHWKIFNIYDLAMLISNFSWSACSSFRAIYRDAVLSKNPIKTKKLVSAANSSKYRIAFLIKRTYEFRQNVCNRSKMTCVVYKYSWSVFWQTQIQIQFQISDP